MLGGMTSTKSCRRSHVARERLLHRRMSSIRKACACLSPIPYRMGLLAKPGVSRKSSAVDDLGHGRRGIAVEILMPVYLGARKP